MFLHFEDRYGLFSLQTVVKMDANDLSKKEE